MAPEVLEGGGPTAPQPRRPMQARILNGKQLGKFSSAEDGHKRKYIQVLRGLLFDSPCTCKRVCKTFAVACKRLQN